MFKFNIFSSLHWQHLIRSELRGFPGFVFGILILSALPIYIATTTLIIRTKNPLFTIPVPGFIKTIWSHMQPTLINPPATEQSDENKSKEQKSDYDDLPSELPSELRTAYLRARMNITPEQRSSFNQPAQSNTNTPTFDTTESNTPDEIPLPTDFDVPPTSNENINLSDTDFSQISAPTFSDISFETSNITTETNHENLLTKYLDKKEIKYKTKNDIIITEKNAIASHTDTDFWICDNDNWFATGKQRPSPIKELLEISTSKKLQPLLYLGSTNIMDLETICQTWESMGITIITTPDEIPE